MFALKITRTIYKALSGRLSPGLVVWALALGLLAALVPLSPTAGSLYLILMLLLFTRASFGIFMLPLMFLKPLVVLWLWQPIQQVGHLTLEAEGIRWIWRWLVNLPVVALLELDRYSVMGAYVVTVVATAVMAWPVILLIKHIRKHIVPRLDEYRIVRWFKSFAGFQLFKYIFIG